MKKNKKNIKELDNFGLPQDIKRWIWGSLFFLLSLIIIFSFFELSGVAGEGLMKILTSLVGKTVFAIPFIFLLSAIIFFSPRYKNFLLPLILTILLLTLGISGILESLNQNKLLKQKTEIEHQGGWIGYLFSAFLIK